MRTPRHSGVAQAARSGLRPVRTEGKHSATVTLFVFDGGPALSQHRPNSTSPHPRGYVQAFASDLNPHLPTAPRFTLPDYQMSQQIIRVLRRL